MQGVAQRRMWSIVNEAKDPNVDRRKWKRKEEKARAAILLSFRLDTNPSGQGNNVKEAWEIIEKHLK